MLGNQHPAAVQAEEPVVLRLGVLRSGLRVGLEPLNLRAADALRLAPNTGVFRQSVLGSFCEVRFRLHHKRVSRLIVIRASFECA